MSGSARGADGGSFPHGVSTGEVIDVAAFGVKRCRAHREPSEGPAVPGAKAGTQAP
jgi:hypothetical protein